MHDIESKDKSNKRYEGLKPKLIHLRPETFKLLDMVAKIKGSNLKEYLETLAEKQAIYETNKFLKQQEEQKNK